MENIKKGYTLDEELNDVYKVELDSASSEGVMKGTCCNAVTK
ncbi:MAG: hypothetical protein ACLKAK_11390 [Alkaliphilus sp.]